MTLVASISWADTSDDTLKLYLSKSDLVVRGTITSEPAGIIDSDGALNYVCVFKVSDVLKGNPDLKDKTVKVSIMRFELDEKDHHPLITKGAESILFLKQAKDSAPKWETADYWFGMQHPFPFLAKSLKRLAKEEASRTTIKPRP